MTVYLKHDILFLVKKGSNRMVKVIKELLLGLLVLGIPIVSSVGIAFVFDYGMRIINTDLVLAIILLLICAVLMLVAGYVTFYAYWWSILHITKNKIDDYNNQLNNKQNATEENIKGKHKGSNRNNSNINISHKGSNENN